MDLVTWLDSHEGFAIVLVTAVYTIVTLLLVLVTVWLAFESRRQRVEASVAAWAAPWDLAGGLYIAILVENAGPAAAREVSVDWWLDRKVDAPKGVLREPVFAVGFRRTIPMKAALLDQLAAEGASIRVELAWRDGRRGTQTRSVKTTCKEIQAAYAESGALPRPSLLETLDQIRDQLKLIAKE